MTRLPLFWLALLATLCLQRASAQIYLSPIPDSIRSSQDPFGRENSPDHTGQGSGGVMTPSPYENLLQTYFTRINADYYGVQYMLDSPLQIAVGSGWSAYEESHYGVMAKIRTTGFREQEFNLLRGEWVPYYLFSTEASIEYPMKQHGVRAFKIRTHVTTGTEGLSMPGTGVLVSKWNFLAGADRTMGRRFELEGNWIQVVGGYIMPLSPHPGGINLALCFGVELFGVKYQTYYSGIGEFVGAKIGSVGWTFDFGWNAGSAANLSGYIGGEWGFSTGGLHTATDKIVFADVARTTLFFGLQATGRWVNITGGIGKEWEYLDFQGLENSDRGIRYHLGFNVYFRR